MKVAGDQEMVNNYFFYTISKNNCFFIDFSSSRDDYEYDRRQSSFSARGSQQTRGNRGNFQQSRGGNFGSRVGREGNGRGGTTLKYCFIHVITCFLIY